MLKKLWTFEVQEALAGVLTVVALLLMGGVLGAMLAEAAIMHQQAAQRAAAERPLPALADTPALQQDAPARHLADVGTEGTAAAA